MKNHEGINYLHFPDDEFALLLDGDNIKKVREITDEGGNMLKYVLAQCDIYAIKCKFIYTPLGKPSITVPKISTFLGNNRIRLFDLGQELLSMYSRSTVF